VRQCFNTACGGNAGLFPGCQAPSERTQLGFRIFGAVANRAASLFAIENAAGNARRRRKTSFGAAGPTRSLPVACRSMIPPGEVFVGSRPGRARAFSERAGAWVTAWQPSQAKSTACAAVLLFACAVWVRGPVADWAHGIQREMKQRFAAQRESLNQRERQWREQQERRTRPVRRASYEEGAR
jgi:hypothetical protein